MPSKTQSLKQWNRALERFIKLVRPQLFSLLRTMVSSFDAEEILQEAFLKVYQLAQQNPKPASEFEKLMALQAFLYTVAKNQAISRLRHQNIVSEHRLSSQILNQDQLSCSFDLCIDEESDKTLLLAAINTLPPICRQVFIQRKIHEKSYSEIAHILQISVKTVENHLAKGLKLCQQYVNTHAGKSQGSDYSLDKSA